MADGKREREKRLAEALRRNLRRRKDAARQHPPSAAEGEEKPRSTER